MEIKGLKEKEEAIKILQEREGEEIVFREREIDPAFELRGIFKNFYAFDIYKNLTTQCVICCLDFEAESVISCFPCAHSHFFHQDCALQWIQRSKSCPLCKKNLE